MPNLMERYDPSKVIVTFAGYPLTGYADGTFVTVSRNEDSFTLYVGSDGETARARNQNKSGTVVLTLKMTSQANDYLSLRLKLDETGGAGVGAIAVTDLLGRTRAFAAQAWVRKPADAEFGKEIGEREWTFECASLELLVGGNLPLGA